MKREDVDKIVDDFNKNSSWEFRLSFKEIETVAKKFDQINGKTFCDSLVGVRSWTVEGVTLIDIADIKNALYNALNI